MNNEITINIEEILKVDDNSIVDPETIRQIGLATTNFSLKLSKDEIFQLSKKIKKEYQVFCLYPHQMQKCNIQNMKNKFEYKYEITVTTKNRLSYDDLNVIKHDFRARLQGYHTECPKQLFGADIQIKGKFTDEEFKSEIPITDRIIVLNRKDLQTHRKYIPLDEITFRDFKNESLSAEDAYKASIILFIDEDKTIKELKNRY